MESVLRTIKEDKLIQRGDIIGIAVSGGSDSMALLHFLNTNKTQLDITIVAIHLDHSIRENSERDSDFVADYCKENNIRLLRTKVNVPQIAEKESLSLEQAARNSRYTFFDAIINKGLVDKIALAHHISDQCETILMHIFRGSGLSGAKGMETMRGDYIRPMLGTDKKEILFYLNANGITYMEDETNADCEYTRNYIRNKIIPLIKSKYDNVERAVCNFGKNCKEDGDYINRQLIMDAILTEKNCIKIPLNYFIYDNSIINRIIFKSLERIHVLADIERKHVDLIKDLALNGENGSKIDLPNQLTVHKEYEYISIVSRKKTFKVGEQEFKSGKIHFEEFGDILIRKSTQFNFANNIHLLDSKKIPKTAVWRYKQEGDTFEKFGGGTKKLKSYLIDKKIPLRFRSNLPLLAFGNEILVIAGIEISEKVKIDKNTKSAYVLEYQNSSFPYIKK